VGHSGGAAKCKALAPAGLLTEEFKISKVVSAHSLFWQRLFADGKALESEKDYAW
jgi:hypothetical protein